MRTIHHRPLLLLFLFLLGVTSSHYLVAAPIGSQSTRLGGFSPIEDVHDPHIQELGAFAVMEFNKSSRVQLVFIRVISAEKQVVAGISYTLVVEAKDSEAAHQYQAIVYEKAWANYRQLVSFAIKA